MVEALIDSVADSANKNQPGAAKALADWGGLNAREQNVHIGDNLNTISIDKSQHLSIMERTDEESAARRLELEQRFGLA